MNPQDLLHAASNIAMVALSLALLVVVVRIFRGPTLPDRIVALDLLIGVVIGLIAALTVRTGQDSYLDIAIALGLVGFLATVALARFVLRRGQMGDAPNTLPDGDEAAPRASTQATPPAGGRS
jgi:multicomponent Na+:H+ antiporter subunit F